MSTLHIVPTNGNVRHDDGQLWPSAIGGHRLNQAAYAAHSLNGGVGESEILLLGGERPNPEDSEANVLYRQRFYYCSYLKPDEESGRVRFYRLAAGKYTAADMIALADHLLCKGAWNKLCLWTHPDHGELAIKTLQAYGVSLPVEICPSGEPPPYKWVVLRYLRFLAWADPCWKKGWSWPLRWLANRRGRNE